MTPDVVDRLSDPLAAALVDESTGNRLSIKVDLGELGVVQVAANRSANGIELALVVQSQAASQALEQQSQMLLSSLQQGGIRVVGIEVRCDGERGTGFARKRGEPSRIEPKATAAVSGRQATPKKPGDQRVDVLA